MNDRDWDVVPYTPQLAGELLALHRRAWPDAEIAGERFLRWQYDENPVGAALSTLARSRANGALIAQFGAIPVRLWAEGAERLGAIALNVVTDEAFRMQGVFSALGRAADERMAQADASVAFAMPNENSFPGFIRRLGYTHAGDVPFLVRPVNLRRLVSNRLAVPGAGALAAIAAVPFVRSLPRAPKQEPDVSVERVDSFDAPFDDFWRRIRGREPVMLVRDVRYLDWRYRKVPLRRYDIFRAMAGERQTGYIVLRVADVLGLRAGLIVDFLAEDERSGRALVSHALARFATEDIDLVAALMLAHAPEYRLLRSAGLRALPRRLLPQPFHLVARDGDLVRDARNWFFTMGDYDVA